MLFIKTGTFFDNFIFIHQIRSFCDCDEHKRVEQYAMTCRKVERAILTQNIE